MLGAESIPNFFLVTFTYDPIDQLLSETRPGYLCEYDYDANGNRLYRRYNGDVVNQENYLYDGADKLTEIRVNGNPVRSFGYDACGRTTAITNSTGTTTFAWDYEDRLVAINYPGGAQSSFAYNGFGARVSKTDTSGSYTFHRAGSGASSFILSDGRANYTPGISERRDGVSRFYHFDASTSTKQLSDGSPSFSDTWSYDAWGNVLSRIRDTSTPFQFGGGSGYTLDWSGFVFSGVGIFDTTTGRYLTPTGGGGRGGWGGGYAPVGNNPLGFIPPLGDPQPIPYGLPKGNLEGGVPFDLTDFVCGWGDVVSGTVTDTIRDWLGVNDNVNKYSSSYGWGMLAGVGNSVLLFSLPRPYPGAGVFIIGENLGSGRIPAAAKAIGAMAFESKVGKSVEAVIGLLKLKEWYFSASLSAKIIRFPVSVLMAVENVGWLLSNMLLGRVLVDYGPLKKGVIQSAFYRIESFFVDLFGYPSI